MCKHGNIAEKREDTMHRRLEPMIRAAYAEKHTGLIQSSKRQLFRVTLEKRLKFQSSLNKKWLDMVRTSRNANSRR